MKLFRRAVFVLVLPTLVGCNPQGFNAGPATPAAASKVATWQLIPISDGGVWKINTETGETRRCIDGMVEKACVLAVDVESVAQLKASPSPTIAPESAAPVDGLSDTATPVGPTIPGAPAP